MSNNSSNPLYYIYLNLHSSNPKTFSLMQNGLVTKYLASFKIERARFLVRKGGHATAVKEQTRNVHAFVVCDPKHVVESKDVNQKTLDYIQNQCFPVHCHYNDGDFFSIKFGDETIPLDEDYEFRHVLLHDHKCYLLKHVAYEYLLKRKVTAKHFLDTLHTGFSEAFIKAINLLINAHAENKLNEMKASIMLLVSVQTYTHQLKTIYPINYPLAANLVWSQKLTVSLVTLSLNGRIFQGVKISQSKPQISQIQIINQNTITGAKKTNECPTTALNVSSY